MAGSNILLFDESKTNMMDDSDYAEAEARTDGVQTGVASSELQNKVQYQLSLVAYAIGQLMVANDLDASDEDEVEDFVSNLSNTLVQKVVDLATSAEAQAGTNDTHWMSPAKVKAFFDYMQADDTDATTGTDDTKWMSAAKVKEAIDEFAPSASGGVTAAWNGENLVFEKNDDEEE